MTISERTLRKWRKEALTINKMIEKGTIPELPSRELCNWIIRMTQELLDQHLLRK